MVDPGGAWGAVAPPALQTCVCTYSNVYLSVYDVTHMYTLTHTAVDYQVTKKSFKFARTHHLPFFFVSASDGTNVVKVHTSASVAYRI